MARKKKSKSKKTVETIKHEDANRVNIPTAEYQSVMSDDDKTPIQAAYERRNRDLDPQLVWRGKDQQNWTDLVVQAPPLYIQEKVHPKVLIDDLMRHQSIPSPAEAGEGWGGGEQTELFADFNGLADEDARTEFYQHEGRWQNRMILGDSLQVMASLAEREGLRGKVQCIYIDPPYGIKFNSNFQWSTTSRDVKDGKAEHITREPEQVKAFRDTWRDGIHSYLTYLRDRLTVARDLLAESGSIFVQIGDENIHRVRALMDEVFGDDNFVAQITFRVKSPLHVADLGRTTDFIAWYTKSKPAMKFRQARLSKSLDNHPEFSMILKPDGTSESRATMQENIQDGYRFFTAQNLASSGYTQSCMYNMTIEGRQFDHPRGKSWKTHIDGMRRLAKANRLQPLKTSLRWRYFFDDAPSEVINDVWQDTFAATDKSYVVETSTSVVQRCLLMTSDPGDLVLDPTCGSGTTAYVAEHWGRRWITIDTSRVALALARARIMGARYPYYLLADSSEGQQKEAEVSRVSPSNQPTGGRISQGFVYQRVPHITLKSIANNTEIDVIWEEFEEDLKPLRESLTEALPAGWLDSYRKKQNYNSEVSPEIQEWEIPRDFPDGWSDAAKKLHERYWLLRIERQKKIDASIAGRADQEYLYDKPYEDKNKVRVAGPFTVESLSPHRVLGVDENDELIDRLDDAKDEYGGERDFVQMILENLKTAGVQQAHKEDRINFTALKPWPGDLICAEGVYRQDERDERDKKESKNSDHLVNPVNPVHEEQRAAIFIGPEFGTVSRPDLVQAAREAADAGFDVLIACAFNYEAHASEFHKLGRIPVLKARMNADLHMADDLKNTGKGNLFVIFGEPDITVASEEWLVDSKGNRIAPYEIFKLVSGTESLAEINGLDYGDLQMFAPVSRRREVWDYLRDQTSGLLDSGEYRGGTGTQNDRGVSAIAWHSAGIPGGTGDIFAAVRKAGISESGEFRNLVERLHRDQQNAQQPDQITIHTPLTTCNYHQVKVNGVDVFHPSTGEVRSDGPEGIACWFIDTDYNEESFFVRQAYFLGANDPYKALKTTLKAEIDEEAWQTLHSDTSRPFPKPESGRIAVKVINHLGDEVMKAFKVS